MRMFLLFFLLLVPITTNASTCDSFNNPEDPDSCTSTEGCYWDGTFCSECSATQNGQGYYCPAGAICDDGHTSTNGRCSCPAPFTSSLPGTINVEGCFAEVTCDDGSADGIRAGVQYGAAPWYLAPIGNNQWWGPGVPGVNDFTFHPEVTGTGTDMVFTCQPNTISCGAFHTNGCAEITGGNATWVVIPGGTGDDDYWDVSACKCRNEQITMTDHNCSGSQTFSAISSQTNVQHVTDPIGFSTTADSYYCTSCVADSGTNVYYGNKNANAGGCDKNLSQGHICSCITLNHKGSYRTGLCGAGQDWSSSTDICDIADCPLPGQTTSTIGPMGPSDCQYGNATKICDGDGTHCVTLNTVISGVSADAWTLP